MLTCFLKPETERSIRANIIKFSERIWIESEEGDATILRTFLVRVEADQNESTFFHRMSILLPFSIEQIQEAKDLSATALVPNYIWNLRTTGGYEILDEKNQVIRFDSLFPVQVEKHLQIDKTQIANSTELDLNFSEPILPGRIRLVRFVFKVKNLFKPLDTTEKSYVSFDLPYFFGTPARRALEILNVDPESNLEMKVYPMLNAKRREGGFDVHLVALPNMVLSSSDFKPTTGICSYNFEGKNIQEREVMLWRLRNSIPSEEAISVIGKEFSIHVMMYRPVHYHQIANVVKDTEKLNNEVFQTILKLKWNIVLTMVALILSILAVVFTLFRK